MHHRTRTGRLFLLGARARRARRVPGPAGRLRGGRRLVASRPCGGRVSLTDADLAPLDAYIGVRNAQWILGDDVEVVREPGVLRAEPDDRARERAGGAPRLVRRRRDHGDPDLRRGSRHGQRGHEPARPDRARASRHRPPDARGPPRAHARREPAGLPAGRRDRQGLARSQGGGARARARAAARRRDPPQRGRWLGLDAVAASAHVPGRVEIHELESRAARGQPARRSPRAGASRSTCRPGCDDASATAATRCSSRWRASRGPGGPTSTTTGGSPTCPTQLDRLIESGRAGSRRRRDGRRHDGARRQPVRRLRGGRAVGPPRRRGGRALGGAQPSASCRGRAHRGVFGKSSGGYGALMMGLEHADVFAGVACHSGDCYFEYCYGARLPEGRRRPGVGGGAGRVPRGACEAARGRSSRAGSSRR